MFFRWQNYNNSFKYANFIAIFYKLLVEFPPFQKLYS